MKRKLKLFIVVFITLPFSSYGQFTNRVYESTDGSIIDEKVFTIIEKEADRMISAGETPTLAELASQLKNVAYKMKLPAQKNKVRADSDIYTTCKPGVLVVATIYKCQACPNNHIRAASGFSVSKDGIGVTSYHIFRGNATDENTDIAVVIMDYEGKVYPVEEVLVASFNDDIAVFKFNTKGNEIEILPLGNDPEPGDEISVISHPHSMFYSFTKGYVSRSYLRNEAKKVSITAEFSQGSSGAPVLDQKGNVVGVVSATLSLYNSDNNLQMVSREIIPASKIRSLVMPVEN